MVHIAGTAEVVGRTILTAFITFINALVDPIVDFALPLITKLLKQVVESPNFLLNPDPQNPAIGSIAHQIWLSSFTVVNALFLLALIIASIAIILRVNTGTYQIKKFLTSLTIAIILSNLSFIIVKALVEIGDILTNGISQAITSHNWKAYLYALGEYNISGVSGGGLTRSLTNLLLAGLITWLLLKLAILLYERLIVIFLLAVVAPFAFALSLLPIMLDYTKDWWTTIIKWILVLPMFVALMSVGALILTQGGPSDKLVENLNTLGSKLTGGGLIDPQTIAIVVGLIFIGLAGEVPKKLKLTTPLSGLVGSTPMEAYKKAKPLALKGAGYIGKTGYNIALGTETGKKFEGWRQAQTGIVGMFVNPKGRKERMEADRKLALQPHIASSQGATAGRFGGFAENLKTKYPDLKIDPVTGKVEGTAPGYVKALYKRFVTQSKAAQGGLEWRVREANKSIGPADVPEFETLRQKIAEAKGPGEKAILVHQMKILSRARNIRPDEAVKAAEYFDSLEGKTQVQKANLKESDYRVSIKPAERLRIARVQSAMSADAEVMKAEEEIQTQATVLENEINANSLPADLIPPEAVNVALKIETSLGSTGLNATDTQIQNILDAREATHSNDNTDLRNWLATYFNNNNIIPSQNDIDKYTAINDALNRAGAGDGTDNSAIRNYQSLRTATTSGTLRNQPIQAVLTRIQNIQNDIEYQENIVKQANTVIKEDNKDHGPASRLIIQNKINSYVAQGQTQYEARNSVTADIRAAQNKTKTALQDNGYVADTPITSIGSTELNDLRNRFQNLGIPATAIGDDKTIGEAHAILRRLNNNLNPSSPRP